MWLLHKNFDSKKPSKKLDHVKLGLFKFLKKVIKVTFKLNLLLRIKFYLMQYIFILKTGHRNLKRLVYKFKTYKGQKRINGQLKKTLSHKQIDKLIFYKIIWRNYKEIMRELEKGLKNAKEKV